MYKIQAMETIFARLDGIGNLKQELRKACRDNGIKISFTLAMTYTKSRAIYKRLESTYQRGLGKLKARWLENELKLFQFVLVSVSVLSSTKISLFKDQEWQMLRLAFPHKLPSVLEYEAKNFISDKSSLKRKWQEDQDRIFASIVASKDQELKWNEIATQLFVESERRYFRNGKQCRERWLNHLDTTVKHEKWTQDEDLLLLRGVLENGKKWSRIMKHFNNQRTEHMIKNRYLSLILRSKKAHPLAKEEEKALSKLCEEMGLINLKKSENKDQTQRRRLRSPKTTAASSKQKQSQQGLLELQSIGELVLSGQMEVAPDHRQGFSLFSPFAQADCLQTSLTTLPTPQSPMLGAPLMGCGAFFPFGYFEYYMNQFYATIGPGDQQGSPASQEGQ